MVPSRSAGAPRRALGTVALLVGGVLTLTAALGGVLVATGPGDLRDPGTWGAWWDGDPEEPEADAVVGPGPPARTSQVAVVRPGDQQEVRGDRRSIEVDFAGVVRTTQDAWVSVVRVGGCRQPSGTSRCRVDAFRTVGPSTRRTSVSFLDELGQDGEYRVRVALPDERKVIAASTFTLTGGTNDTTPDATPWDDSGVTLRPGDHDAVQQGWTGPLKVRLAPGTDVDRLRLDLDSDIGYATSVRFTAPAEVGAQGGTVAVPVPELRNHGAYWMRVVDVDTGETLTQTDLRVVPSLHYQRVLRITDVSTPTVYPRPDGYLDSTALTFHQRYAGTATLEVSDTDGRVVRRTRLGRLDAGTHRATWDGARGNGRPVPDGDYVATVLLPMDSGEDFEWAYADVRVASGPVTERTQRVTYGARTTSRTTAGGCTVGPVDGYANYLRLACPEPGRASGVDAAAASAGDEEQLAEVTYRVPLPAGTTRTAWTMTGTSAAVPGLTRTSRSSSRSLLVTVRLTRPGTYVVKWTRSTAETTVER